MKLLQFYNYNSLKKYTLDHYCQVIAFSLTQFCRSSDVELPVIEYPLQQYRLFPYLAASYTLNSFFKQFNDAFMEYLMRVVGGDKSDEVVSDLFEMDFCSNNERSNYRERLAEKSTDCRAALNRSPHG